MPDLKTISLVLAYVSSACEVALLARLYTSGLYRIYRYFSFYIAFLVFRALIAIPLGTGSDAFALIYVTTTPVFAFLYLLVLMELYRVVLAGSPGIATVSRWVILGGFLVALAVAALTLGIDARGAALWVYPPVLLLHLFDRMVSSTVAFFLVLLTAFLVWFPVPLKRNVVVYSLGYSLYFVSRSLALLLRNVAGPSFVDMSSIINLSISILCVLAWAFLLRADGEQERVVVGHKWSPGEAERLVEQLNSLNATLLRTARR